MQFSRGHTINNSGPAKRSARNKSKLIGRRVLAVFGCLVFVLLAFGAVMTQIYGDVEVDSVNSSLSKRVEASVHGYFDKNPLARLVGWLNKNELSAYLTDEIPELSSDIYLSREGFFTPTMAIEVSPREPLVIWSISDQKYFVDNQGVVFSENYFPLNPGVEVADGNNIKIGEKMPKKMLSFIGQFMSDVNESDVRITKISIPSGQSREVDIDVAHSDKSITFKLSTDRSTMAQVEDVGRVLKHFEANNMDIASLSYVDIRVEGRAFYK